MAKYRVLQPWFGVKRNDIVELKTLNPCIAAQVELVTGKSDEAKDEGDGKKKGTLTVNPGDGEGSTTDGAKK